MLEQSIESESAGGMENALEMKRENRRENRRGRERERDRPRDIITEGREPVEIHLSSKSTNNKSQHKASLYMYPLSFSWYPFFFRV
jgi:hypothetical protein